MKVLDLFSGIGGFSLGLERAGMQTVAFCEIDFYCRRVLNRHWPGVPIYEDVRDVTAERLAADGLTDIDIITGGYPCQPFSLAGKRAGKDDNRHLWPEIARLVSELSAAGRKPAWLLFENVAGHITMGLDAVLSDLEELGYAGWPLVIPACAVDARHRRDRVWILCADTEHNGSPEQKIEYKLAENSDGSCKFGLGARDDVADTACELSYRGWESRASRWKQHTDSSEVVADTNNPRSQRMRQEWTHQGWEAAIGYSGQGSESDRRTWPVEPAICRVANGVPRRMDRLRGLGNAVVPQIPEIIGRAIIHVESLNNRS